MKFLGGVIDLRLQLEDEPVATANGVTGAHVGFVDNGAHG